MIARMTHNWVCDCLSLCVWSWLSGNYLVVTPDVRPSGGVGLTSDSWRQSLASGHFFLKKNPIKKNQNPPFFSWKQGHSEAEETHYSPTVHHCWDTQTKQTRQTYRQSIETTRRQFTKRWKWIIRPRKHVTKELRNIRVKLNWEEHIWILSSSVSSTPCAFVCRSPMRLSSLWISK